MSPFSVSKTCPFSPKMVRDEVRDKQVYDMVADYYGTCIYCLLTSVMHTFHFVTF